MMQYKFKQVLVGLFIGLILQTNLYATGLMEPKAYIQSTYQYDAQGQIKSQSSIGKDGLNLTQTTQRDLNGDVIQNTLSNTSGEPHDSEMSILMIAAGQIVSSICDKFGNQCVRKNFITQVVSCKEVYRAYWLEYITRYSYDTFGRSFFSENNQFEKS